MTTKCNGLMGRVFGHKWEVRREVIKPKEGDNYTAGSVGLIEYGKCLRCGAVTGEKK